MLENNYVVNAEFYELQICHSDEAISCQIRHHNANLTKNAIQDSVGSSYEVENVT